MAPPSAQHLQPDLAHVSLRHPDVYPPHMPDTLFFLEILRDLELRTCGSTTVVCEVGCGAAPLATLLAMHLGSSAATLAFDLHSSACSAAAETAQCNNIVLQVARMDLVAAMRPGLIDLLLCHPPYVPTSAVELETARASSGEAKASVEAAKVTWAGGPGGTRMLGALCDALPRVLSPDGFALVLWFERELSSDAFGLEALGLCSTLLGERHANGETFCILRIERASSASSPGARREAAG